MPTGRLMDAQSAMLLHGTVQSFCIVVLALWGEYGRRKGETGKMGEQETDSHSAHTKDLNFETGNWSHLCTICPNFGR